LDWVIDPKLGCALRLMTQLCVSLLMLHGEVKEVTGEGYAYNKLSGRPPKVHPLSSGAFHFVLP